MALFLNWLTLLVIVLGIINLLRMGIFLIGADIYGLKNYLVKRKKSEYEPKFSVVIPAYNEEKSIIDSLSSVLASDYPENKLEVMVVNDGSTDRTAKIVKDYILRKKLTNVKLINQANSGKAHALNNGIKNYTEGELVMCLDADSELAPEAIKNAVRYFEQPKVMALATNVKIKRVPGFLNLIQTFEYAISYQMKRAQTLFNIEYIVGGIGSTFRRDFLELIDCYDTNTVTEDIDLTMKILRNGNKQYRVVYGPDVVTYTQSALTFNDLIKQRYRWKWGRYQTFLKNKSMFFSGDKRYTKGLSWIYLPYAIFSDLVFFLEPLLVTYIWALVFYYQDWKGMLAMVGIITCYLGINILAEDTFSGKEKVKLVLLTPMMYFLFYFLSLVEYVALIKSWINMPRLKISLLENKNSWQPISRPGLKRATLKVAD